MKVSFASLQLDSAISAGFAASQKSLSTASALFYISKSLAMTIILIRIIFGAYSALIMNRRIHYIWKDVGFPKPR